MSCINFDLFKVAHRDGVTEELSLCDNNPFYTNLPWQAQEIVYHYEKTFIMVQKKLARCDFKVWFEYWNPFGFVCVDWQKENQYLQSLQWCFPPLFNFEKLKDAQWWLVQVGYAHRVNEDFVKINDCRMEIDRGRLIIYNSKYKLCVSACGITEFNSLSLEGDYNNAAVYEFLKYWATQFSLGNPECSEKFSFNVEKTFAILCKISS